MLGNHPRDTHTKDLEGPPPRSSSTYGTRVCVRLSLGTSNVSTLFFVSGGPLAGPDPGTATI